MEAILNGNYGKRTIMSGDSKMVPVANFYNGYVPGKLLLYVDGIMNKRYYHLTTTKNASIVWDDLSGNKNDISCSRPTTITDAINYIRFNYNEGGTFNSAFNPNVGDGFTLEITLSNLPTGTVGGSTKGAIWIPYKASGDTNIYPALRYNIGSGIGVCSKSTPYYPIDTNKTYHLFQIRYNSEGVVDVHDNGVLLEPSTKNTSIYQNNQVDGKTRFCNTGVSQSQALEGRLYSVRAYTRQLTNAELERNRLNDIKRFNIEEQE